MRSCDDGMWAGETYCESKKTQNRGMRMIRNHMRLFRQQKKNTKRLIEMSDKFKKRTNSTCDMCHDTMTNNNGNKNGKNTVGKRGLIWWKNTLETLE